MRGAPPDRCDIWWLQARSSEADLALLDHEERERYRRFRLEADRRRFATAAALLRRAAGGWVGSDPRRLAIDRTCAGCGQAHGKPTVPGVHASVTHAGDWVGVALTATGPVGIDLEPRSAPVHEIAGEMLAPREVCEDDEQLLRIWTRKESIVKATGEGIGVGLSRIRVSPATAAPELHEHPALRRSRAQMRDLTAVPGYIASATVLTNRPVRWVEHHGSTTHTKSTSHPESPA